MNPFLEDWPRLHRHYREGCLSLAKSYFDLRNVQLPAYEKARGRIVVVAGCQGIGGKSVLSHQLLHQYDAQTAPKMNAIDLSAPQGPATGDVMRWLRRAVRTANITLRIIDDVQAEQILGQDDLEYMSVTFGRALAHRNSAAVIRIPFDESLLIRAVAGDIRLYAESARFLGDSLYVYEYGYYDDADLGKLRGMLEAAQVDNAWIIQAPPLLASDAERFIEIHLSTWQPGLELAVRNAVRESLRGLAAPRGLELDIAGFNHVMHEAFSGAQRDGYDYLASHIEAEYKAYLERRRQSRDGGYD